jgi:hypothetical protein
MKRHKRKKGVRPIKQWMKQSGEVVEKGWMEIRMGERVNGGGMRLCSM